MAIRFPFARRITTRMAIALLAAGLSVAGLSGCDAGAAGPTPVDPDASSPPAVEGNDRAHEMAGHISVYGSGFGMDGLGNMQLGGPNSPTNVLVSYRFRAEQSSTLAAFRAFWMGLDHAPDYAHGTGGNVRVTVEADQDGKPSGTALAALEYAPGKAPYFPLLSFAEPAQLTAGERYHLVFTNIDPSPRVNFVSLDLGYVSDPTTPRQPRFADADWAALRMDTGVGDEWTVEHEYTPILDLTFGNGAHQGQGYQWADSGNEAVIHGTSRMVRERIVVSGPNQVVHGAAVRIAKTGGEGQLHVRLEDRDGALIDSFSVSTDSVPTMESTDDTPGGVWVTGSFAAPQTLLTGSTYFLRLSTDSQTSLWTRPVEEGSPYGFDKATYFSDGYLELTSDGGESWRTSSGIDTAGDLQFYLE